MEFLREGFKDQGAPTPIRRVDVPANQQREVVVGHGPGPCWTVRTTQTGNWLPMVLKRSTLPVAQPLPQPSAGRRKYGTPVAGLLGAQSALVLPVAITPTFSPMTSNEVLLVIRTTQRSVSAPRLVTVIGYWVVEGGGGGAADQFIRPAAVPGALVEHEVHAGEQVTGHQRTGDETARDRIAGLASG